MKSRIVWLLLCCIWGSTWLFIKIGLRDLPPISFAAIRFLIAVIILAAIIAVRRLSLPRSPRDWWMLAGTGVLAFALNYGLIFWVSSTSLPASPPYCKPPYRRLV